MVLCDVGVGDFVIGLSQITIYYTELIDQDTHVLFLSSQSVYLSVVNFNHFTFLKFWLVYEYRRLS